MRSLLGDARFGPNARVPAEQQIGFAPAMVVAESKPAVPAPAGLAIGGAIEIEFATGARMWITGPVDTAALRTAVAALAEGPRR